MKRSKDKTSTKTDTGKLSLTDKKFRDKSGTVKSRPGSPFGASKSITIVGPYGPGTAVLKNAAVAHDLEGLDTKLKKLGTTLEGQKIRPQTAASIKSYKDEVTANTARLGTDRWSTRDNPSDRDSDALIVDAVKAELWL